MASDRYLTVTQIEAALRLYHRLRFWKATNHALESLQEKFPTFDFESTLLKVSSVNALYGTRLLAIAKMAERATNLLQHKNLQNLGIEVVLDLASLDKKRVHLSFASKFAHFFIDPVRFPIFDRFAADMLRCHLDLRLGNRVTRYEDFVRGFLELKLQAGFNGSNRDFDKYLWLAGACRQFEEKPTAPINAELNALFKSREQEVRHDLALMLGTVPRKGPCGSYDSIDIQR